MLSKVVLRNPFTMLKPQSGPGRLPELVQTVVPDYWDLLFTRTCSRVLELHLRK